MFHRNPSSSLIIQADQAMSRVILTRLTLSDIRLKTSIWLIKCGIVTPCLSFGDCTVFSDCCIVMRVTSRRVELFVFQSLQRQNLFTRLKSFKVVPLTERVIYNIVIYNGRIPIRLVLK